MRRTGEKRGSRLGLFMQMIWANCFVLVAEKVTTRFSLLSSSIFSVSLATLSAPRSRLTPSFFFFCLCRVRSRFDIHLTDFSFSHLLASPTSQSPVVKGIISEAANIFPESMVHILSPIGQRLVFSAKREIDPLQRSIRSCLPLLPLSLLLFLHSTMYSCFFSCNFD